MEVGISMFAILGGGVVIFSKSTVEGVDRRSWSDGVWGLQCCWAVDI